MTTATYNVSGALAQRMARKLVASFRERDRNPTYREIVAMLSAEGYRGLSGMQKLHRRLVEDCQHAAASIVAEAAIMEAQRGREKLHALSLALHHLREFDRENEQGEAYSGE